MMGLINDGLLFPRQVMSLRHAGIGAIEDALGLVRIGGAVTIAGIARLTSLPTLAQAAALIGGPAVRNMATAGGNLFARAPYGDLAAPLLALDARVELVSPRGWRTLPLEAFFSQRAEAIQPIDELLTTIQAPYPEGRNAYLRLARRQANAPAVVSVAVHLSTAADGVCTGARIALGAAGPFPQRATQAEAVLVGTYIEATHIAAAAEIAMAECDPYTDAHASTWYRRKMVGVFVRRALEQAMRAA
jgi:CO/xanthine dehydrogenase FAD-binding subunit